MVGGYMKDKKGFTLIELLAVIVILGIVMLIAVPNTVSLIDKNKRKNCVENAKTFISLVRSKVQTDKTIELPDASTSAVIMTLGYLNTSDIEESPYGELYDKDLSFVAITKGTDNKYHYYVQLVSCLAKDEADCDPFLINNWRGVEFKGEDDLNNDGSYKQVKVSGVNAGAIENLSSLEPLKNVVSFEKYGLD